MLTFILILFGLIVPNGNIKKTVWMGTQKHMSLNSIVRLTYFLLNSHLYV